ncbi:MAG: PTS sugar transporter subunit IIA [Frankia sp.]|nr:PTS sugar transporter subunit IIA [Frankia sp.]
MPGPAVTAPAGPALLEPAAVRLAETATDRDDAIRQTGQALVDVGAVEPVYVETMLARERSISTYVGDGFAIPHGTLAGRDAVHRDALSVLRFPGGVDWGGSPVQVCIGIAARGDGHVEMLARLATILLDPDNARRLREATSADEVIRILSTDDPADADAADDEEPAGSAAGATDSAAGPA